MLSVRRNGEERWPSRSPNSKRLLRDSIYFFFFSFFKRNYFCIKNKIDRPSFVCFLSTIPHVPLPRTQLDEFSIGYYTRKWKRPIRSILRARCSANDKESLAHDPMDCEPCDMDQVEFSATVFLTKDRKKPAKRLQ